MLWIIGDNFVGDTVEHYYIRKKSTFIADNFQTSVYASDSFTTNNPFAISRIRNALVTAMNQAKYTPKIIAFILENDVSNTVLTGNTVEISPDILRNTFEKLIKYLIRETERLRECFLENLPSKAKKQDDMPYILWVISTQHKNYPDNARRKIFSTALINSTKGKENSITLQLKQIWDQWDNNLFASHNHCFTESGFYTFWEAVDRTIRFCDSTIERRRIKKIEKRIISQRSSHNTQRSQQWLNR